MNNNLKILLLNSQTLKEFDIIAYKNNSDMKSWDEDPDIVNHRNFLKKQEIPFDERGENMEFFRYSLRKSNEERKKREHSN